MDPTSGEHVLLRLPPRPEYVGCARMVAASFARLNGFGEEQVDDLKIAISEGVTNAVRAHLDAGSDASIEVELSLDGDSIVVEITDRGKGFDVERLTDMGKTPAPGSLEGGLGLTVIRSLFAETTIERQPSGGMRLRFEAKREAEPARS